MLEQYLTQDKWEKCGKQDPHVFGAWRHGSSALDDWWAPGTVLLLVASAAGRYVIRFLPLLIESPFLCCIPLVEVVSICSISMCNPRTCFWEPDFYYGPYTLFICLLSHTGFCFRAKLEVVGFIRSKLPCYGNPLIRYECTLYQTLKCYRGHLLKLFYLMSALVN